MSYRLSDASKQRRRKRTFSQFRGSPLRPFAFFFSAYLPVRCFTRLLRTPDRANEKKRASTICLLSKASLDDVTTDEDAVVGIEPPKNCRGRLDVIWNLFLSLSLPLVVPSTKYPLRGPSNVLHSSAVLSASAPSSLAFHLLFHLRPRPPSSDVSRCANSSCFSCPSFVVSHASRVNCDSR